MLRAITIAAVCLSLNMGEDAGRSKVNTPHQQRATLKLFAQYFSQSPPIPLPPAPKVAEWTKGIPLKKSTKFANEFLFLVVSSPAELSSLCFGPQEKENPAKQKQIVSKLIALLKQPIDWEKHMLLIAFEGRGTRTASTLKFTTLRVDGKTLDVRFDFVNRQNDTFRGFTVALAERREDLKKIRAGEQDTEHNAKIVALIEKHGGRIEYKNAKTQSGPIVGMTFHALSLSKLPKEKALTDEQFKEAAVTLAKLKHLKKLDLARSNITDASLTEIAKLKKLASLNLDGTKVTDAQLELLDGLKLVSLQLPKQAKTDVGLKIYVSTFQGRMPSKLYLRSWNITDFGLKYVAKMTALEHLDLGYTSLSGIGLQALRPLKKLRTLKLDGVQLGEPGMTELARLTRLALLSLDKTNITDDGLVRLGNLKDLKFLALNETSVGDDGLKALAALPNLQQLLLSKTSITDAGLRHLAKLKKLEHLDLTGTKLTEMALPPLSELPLKYLVLPNQLKTDAGAGLHLAALQRRRSKNVYFGTWKITDAALKELRKYPDVRKLFVDSTNITDAGLKEIAELKNLEELDLHRTKITDAGLKELTRLPKLQYLLLDETNITDAGLIEVGKIKSLVELDLYQTKITDVGLKHLATLTNLRDLFVEKTQVTPQGAAKLKKLLPKCFITR